MGTTVPTNRTTAAPLVMSGFSPSGGPTLLGRGGAGRHYRQDHAVSLLIVLAVPPARTRSGDSSSRAASQVDE
jgi:hypothetical protein